ncbi:hypothetical protein [Streptomyces sp. G45]|uniref:hypothetical protein n=1 Tax=Streptomyces sp. G45 TaxID=3406627 RepID=UPI003C1C560A
MRTTRTTRLGALVLAGLAALTAGCGSGSAEGPAEAYRRTHPTPTAITTPRTAKDFPCPGERPAPTAAAQATGEAPPPGDHYAENHGFMEPFPLHGQRRCDGLAAVRRVKGALEPLRERGDFAPAHTRAALTALGYPARKVRVAENGPAGVSFLVDAPGMCLEGTVSRTATEADAFDGYPDHPGCDRPSGGH